MESVRFDELELDPRILRAIEDMGFEEATAIQAQSIPAALAGEDLVGQAQTGTGKTASFGIPILQRINPKQKHLQAVILCPTRELAIQSAQELHNLSKYLHGIKILPVYGGQDIVRQIKALKSGVQIVVGTPGRIMDHMRRKTLKLDAVDIVVLDEADEMLNMGFREDIEDILKFTPEERQTLLYSATMPKPIMDIAKTYQRDARIIKVIKKELTVPKIEQYYYEVKPKKKADVLCRLIDMYSPRLSLIFCNTKKTVDELTDTLKGRGYFAEGLHGDMKQSQRDRVMNSFRNGKTEILVATDVAARGIDVDDVEAVFNYDVPQDDEYYVHRIGRTGRAGREGRAFTFISGREIYKLKDIQRYCKTKITYQPIPSIDDVAEIMTDKILTNAGEIIAESNLRKMVNIVEDRVNEEDYTTLDLAAALLKMIIGDSLPEKDEDYSGKHYDIDDLGELDDNGAQSGMIRLFINIGKKNKVRPGDILGAIAGESGIPGDLVGTIDMFDKYTFVEVPRKYGRKVIEAMKHARIKGKSISVEKANKK